MIKIIALGELLIDLTQTGTDPNNYGMFTAYPGGAPANVAVAASKLGADAAFIGKVGDDAFGRSLALTLEKEAVDIRGLYYSSETPTTMAIVSVDKSGERDFSFYRDPGADTRLTSDEALSAIKLLADPESSIAGILHVGSLSLTTSPSREATIAAIEFAKSKGMLISYDPNYRAALWDSEERAVEEMKGLMPYADILKVSDEEMEMLTGTDDVTEGSRMLSEYGINLVMITLGGDGVFVRYDGHSEHVPGCRVKIADTNGAGDTFLGAVLSKLAGRGRGMKDLHIEEVIDIMGFANRAASITCTASGAIPAMPTIGEVNE